VTIKRTPLSVIRSNGKSIRLYIFKSDEVYVSLTRIRDIFQK